MSVRAWEPVEGPTPQPAGPRKFLRPLGIPEAALAKVPANIWTACVLCGYLLVVIPTLARHVLWRDEAQMWLVARASENVSQLLANMNYENRPILWFLLVWPIARFSSNPESMKLLNIAAAGMSAVVVSRWLPLFRLEQLALLGGFLFVLGYSTVTQGYMLAAALTIGWAAAYSRRMFATQFIIAGLMASVHVLFTAIALPLMVVTAIAWAKSSRGTSARDRFPTLAAGFAGVSLALANLWLVIPPADYWFRESPGIPLLERVRDPAVFLDSLHYVASSVVAPGVALPRLLASLPSEVFAIPVAVILVIGLRRAGPSLIAPAIALVVVVGNGVLGYGPYWWHSGPIILIVVLAVVMTRVVTGGPWTRGSLIWQSAALWLVLALQVLAGVSFPGTTLRGSTDYSGSKEAAAIVSAACPRSCPLVTDINYRAAAVSAYLGGQSMYQLNGGLDGTFTIWTRSNLESGDVSWASTVAALAERGPGALAVLSELRDPPAEIEVVGQTGGAVWADEEFLVVRLRVQ
jgi:hypothetical protein